MPGFAGAAQPWHDLFMLFGTASATLVGLLFVAASIGSGFFTLERQAAFRGFVSSSVVIFASVLAASLAGMLPTPSWTLCGLLIGADGLFGLAWAVLVWRGMLRDGIAARIDWDDRLLYGLVPAVGHAVMLAASVLLLTRSAAAIDVLAASLATLLFVGIRNAWDITAWSVLRRPD